MADDDNKEPKDNSSNNPDSSKTGEGEAKSTPDKEELRTLIREEVAAALAGNGSKPSDDSNGDKERTLPRRRADVEKMAEEMVQQAAAKFAHDKEHKELSKLKEPPKHEQQETAPKKLRKLTKALWGDED